MGLFNGSVVQQKKGKFNQHSPNFHHDWFGHATVSQNESQTLASTAKGKLQPRRSQNSATPATFEPAPSEFYFMHTPGIIPANSDVYTTEGPAPDLQPAGMENAMTSLLMTEVQTQSFSLDNMVDDLNQIQEDEQLESPIGQFLSQILISHPHLVPAAVEQQLEQLLTDRDADKEKEEPSASGTDLVLYRFVI
ncbi:Uncharacterized protein Fot_07555 [Forsythia ovata]|uniref:Uncharacterized protein n=1 Tax=Forsythia ovata TaxID=205694 RepID=A0ABD1WW56_9LAMI